MRIFKYIFILICFFSCKNSAKKHSFINSNLNLELREDRLNNLFNNDGLIKIIEKNSITSIKLANKINNLDSLQKVSNISYYPIYTIIGDNIKIEIGYTKKDFLITIDFIDSNDKDFNLYKTISSDEFYVFRKILMSNQNTVVDFGNIYGSGNFESNKYLHCGIDNQEIEYNYKIGYWKFWDLKRNFIAEGEFKIDSMFINGGGCNYIIKTSKVIKDKWKFYDKNSKTIKGDIEQIFKIENAYK